MDLAGLSFCDSSGLEALLAAQRKITAAGGTMELARVPAGVKRMLRLAGLADVFTILRRPRVVVRWARPIRCAPLPPGGIRMRDHLEVSEARAAVAPSSLGTSISTPPRAVGWAARDERLPVDRCTGELPFWISARLPSRTP
ncbi:hypothetical protein DP939_45020 [Spongiactinospora rosea]|uniref:STAS domain-containing protein n=1 Tax=Spongiactinospora rosea TaxID=2248750 RepID=A0A366LCM5_9ACTN|nr:hypothetical protein DP939_45020 [Spongiactinospora rosea]